MFCLLALIVFSILGIVSASQRELAKEAFDCVLKRATFRPCSTGFDKKIKGRITGKLIKRSPRTAKLFNKHFEVLSWVFFILFLGSGFWFLKGGYNFYLYGSCNGLNASGFCAFDPAGANNKISQIENACGLEAPSEKNLKPEALVLADFPGENNQSKDSIVFVGCYNCDYTRKVYPLIRKLVGRYQPNYTFVHFPVKEETAYVSGYIYCAVNQDLEKFWRFNDMLFASNKENVVKKEYVDQTAEKAGLDMDRLKACLLDKETEEVVEKQFEEVRAAGIYGTPTVFINGKALVGPKPYRVYQRLLGKFW